MATIADPLYSKILMVQVPIDRIAEVLTIEIHKQIQKMYCYTLCVYRLYMGAINRFVWLCL